MYPYTHDGGLSDPYQGTIMVWDSDVSDRCRLTAGSGGHHRKD